MLAALLLPLVRIIPAPFHEALIFMALLDGIMRIAYALIFQEGAAPRSNREDDGPVSTTNKLNRPEQGFALPPTRSMPAADLVNPRRETAEAASYTSVTDNTTKLLEEDK